MTDLRKAAERAAQPEQEPVAYRVWDRMGGISLRHTKPDKSEYVEWDELYTAPPSKPWVSLTDDEVHEAAIKCVKSGQSVNVAIRAIEAKLKEKNT